MEYAPPIGANYAQMSRYERQYTHYCEILDQQQDDPDVKRIVFSALADELESIYSDGKIDAYEWLNEILNMAATFQILCDWWYDRLYWGRIITRTVTLDDRQRWNNEWLNLSDEQRLADKLLSVVEQRGNLPERLSTVIREHYKPLYEYHYVVWFDNRRRGSVTWRGSSLFGLIEHTNQNNPKCDIPNHAVGCVHVGYITNWS